MQPNPFKSLARSRKFWLAVFGVVQAIVFNYYGQVPDDLWQAITLLVGVLIASIAYEDGALKAGTREIGQ